MGIAPLAQVIELGNSSGNQKRWTVADGTAISKGILLKFADPKTASLGTGATPFAGIAAMDKEAGDGSTTISAYSDGIFDIRASGAITAGDKVIMSGNGEVISVTASYVTQAVSGAVLNTSIIVGTALETATDQEVIAIDIGNR